MHAYYSGVLTLLEYRCLKTILKLRFKSSLKLSTSLVFAYPKTVKPKASRMGKGKGSFNYAVASVRRQQLVCKIYGLESLSTASASTLNLALLHLVNRTSVKLFKLKGFSRWVD